MKDRDKTKKIWLVRAGLVGFTVLCLTAGFDAGSLSSSQVGFKELGAVIMTVGLAGFLAATWPKTQRVGAVVGIISVWVLLTASSISAIIDPQPATELTSRRMPDSELGVRVLYLFILLAVNTPLLLWARQKHVARKRSVSNDGIADEHAALRIAYEATEKH